MSDAAKNLTKEIDLSPHRLLIELDQMITRGRPLAAHSSGPQYPSRFLRP